MRRLADAPRSRGSPPARLLCAPSSPLPTLGGRDGGGSLPANPGQGRGRAAVGSSNPRGGKLGGGRQRGFRPGRGCRARGCSLTCWSPGGGPGTGGCGSARTRLGAGLRALGAGSAAPGARSPHPTGAAAVVSAPRLGSGSWAPRAARARAGGGVGGGPRLGSAWGLGPRAGSAPEQRAPGSARGAPPALRVKPWAPAGAHTSALTRGRPATESGPRGHGQTCADPAHAGYTHSDLATLRHS